MSVEPGATQPRAPRGPDPTRRRGHRSVRESRPVRAATSGRRPGPPDVEGLTAVVHHALVPLQSRRHALDSQSLRGIIDQLRHGAHDATDPALRAAVHVACAHLSAGNLDEAHYALSTAADVLGRHRR